MNMRYRSLGRSALNVSELCLGTMNFGPRTSEKESFAVLDRAMDAGINFIDTANQYGGSLGTGATELLLGRWLATHRDKRERLVLATKAHEPMSDDINDRGLSARHIQMACDASLKRLGVEHIELYQMHHIDRSAPIDEIWQAMERLIAQGKITYVGSSNFPGWAIAQANERAAHRSLLGLVAEQSLYNLMERRVELEVLPACREYGLGLIPWSPLAGGLLAGRPQGSAVGTDGGRRSGEEMGERYVAHAAQLDAFSVLCEGLGESMSAVALSWLLHQHGVSACIIGPADLAQLEGVLHVPDIVLDRTVLDRIDEIFPPSGEAPEAYAW